MAPLDGPGSAIWEDAGPEGGPSASMRASLKWAMRTMAALNVPGLWPASFKSAMPLPKEALLRAGLVRQPMPAEVQRMDHILSWIRLVPASRADVRQALALRSLNHPLSERELLSLERIGGLLGCSAMQVSRLYDKGIDHITVELARPGLCALSGGCVGPGPAEVLAARRRVHARPRVRRLVGA